MYYSLTIYRVSRQIAANIRVKYPYIVSVKYPLDQHVFVLILVDSSQDIFHYELLLVTGLHHPKKTRSYMVLGLAIVLYDISHLFS